MESVEPDVAAVVDQLDDELRAAGDPERAIKEQAYLKSDLTFYGAGLPAIRQAVRRVRREHPEFATTTVVDLAHALWAAPVFERRMAAAVVLDRYVTVLGPDTLARIEPLIRDSHTWALVDTLATDSVARIVAADPHHRTTDATLRRWAADHDFWVRRSALLAHLLLVGKHGSFETWDRFAGFADAMLDEREFFVRKAIGWVLREASKSRPQLVADWVRPRISRISGVSLREAVRYLPDADRNELMSAYRSRTRRHE